MTLPLSLAFPHTYSLRAALVVVGLLLILPTMAVEVDLLDGEPLRGARIQLDSESLRLDDGSEISLNDVDRIVLNPDHTPLPNDHHGLLLKDGSWLPYTSISAIRDGVSVETPLGTLNIPLGSVVAWGDPQWVNEHRQHHQDHIHLESGSILRGTVLGINEGEVLLRSDELSDEPLPFPLTEISDLHLALPIDRPRGLHFTSSLAVGQPGARIVANDGSLHLQAHPKETITLDNLGQLQVLGGRRAFLSDIPPSEVEEEGAFGTVWNYAVNENIDGSPLKLGGTYYAYGLVIHSRARLSWKLEGNYVRFHTFLGISDAMIPHNVGDCEVSIYVDGERRWHQGSVRVGEPPQRIELDVTGAEKLTVVVDYGARYDIGDHLALAGAWLLRGE
ncbi:MAG: hypothetical protein EA401_04050 [Planctomycetota bacterium]|nr:MAG: hypothetical protein EA401_04050 [Planctomycetota bacterium]